MNRTSGFSLIELLIVLAILAILSGVAAPALGAWLQDNRLESNARKILAVVRLARAEAVGRNVVTKIERHDQHTLWSCELIGKDQPCNNLNDDNNFLSAVDWDNNSIIVGSNGKASAIVSFDQRGRRVLKNGTVDITVCDSRGSESGMMIRINQVGRATLNKIDSAKGEVCL